MSVRPNSPNPPPRLGWRVHFEWTLELIARARGWLAVALPLAARVLAAAAVAVLGVAGWLVSVPVWLLAAVLAGLVVLSLRVALVGRRDGRVAALDVLVAVRAEAARAGGGAFIGVD